MIILLVFAIVSTVLASNCNSGLGHFDPGEITKMITVDTNYSQVFNACNIYQTPMCRFKYDVHNTDQTKIRIYYELFQVNNGSYGEKYEVCNGTCEPGYIYVCCADFEYNFIRVTVENLKKESPIILISLGAEYQFFNHTWYNIYIICMLVIWTILGVIAALFFGYLFTTGAITQNGLTTYFTPQNEHKYACCCCMICYWFCGKKSKKEFPYNWVCCFGKKSSSKKAWVMEKCGCCFNKDMRHTDYSKDYRPRDKYKCLYIYEPKCCSINPI
uniref:Transmembrane protein n=1 Tax=Mimivirus LCMiAC01 TaxID=2506608 RepID=A0A481YZY8_9VIRU|nr:MAG: hypothetical protein LCMiAC01_04110 [Mimivirus LCMiAC01]